jgi:hypothetical protein
MAAPVLPPRLDMIWIRLRMQQQQQSYLSGMLYLRRRKHQERKRRQFWVRPWIERRAFYGNYENLIQELERESRGDFTNYMRMEPNMFHELLLRVAPRLTKRDTNYRRSLEPGLKLAITLRYMATGDSYHSLSYSFRVPHNTISVLVKEVSAAIVAEYEDEVFDFPTTPLMWYQVIIIVMFYYCIELYFDRCYYIYNYFNNMLLIYGL